MRYSYYVILGLLIFWGFGCGEHMLVDPHDEDSLRQGELTDINFLTGEPILPNLIRVGHVGFDGGQLAAKLILENYEDLPGTFEFIDRGVFNSLSVEELRESYDVLIFPWQGSSVVNADWETRLLPFMELGGGIIWEDERNVGDLQPAITGNGGFFSRSEISDEVPILTDGITNNLGTALVRFTDYNKPPFSSFIKSGNGDTVGLWGQFGKGSIVLTGVLANYYGHKEGMAFQQNYYNLALNALLFVATGGGNVDDVYPVDIMVRPGSDHNPVSINLKSRGVLPVAILSTGEFDALQIDRETLRFGATGEEESLATLGNGRPQCGEEDVNGNGLTDMVCHFRIQRTEFDHDSTEGILTGVTVSGTKFKGSVEIKILHSDKE